MRLGSTEAVKHAVHAGLGISIVMAAAVTVERRSGWPHPIPIDDDLLEKDLYVVHLSRGRSDCLARRLTQLLQRSPD